MLEPGDRLERWVVEDRFVGGWGVVYALRDTEPVDDDRVRAAAKTIRPEFSDDPARIEQFDRECYTWLSLGAHKHIVRLYSVDRFYGQAFALGEYVPPGLLPNTLRRWLDANLTELESALRIGTQMCRAIEHARSRGLLVHHDLKPENVMITPSGVAKITDWGLSHLDSLAVGLPSVGDVPYRFSGATTTAVHGTRGYAAPECVGMDAEPTPAADMFSLGVCVVEMLCAARPDPDTAAAEIAPALAPAGASGSRVAEELARCLSSSPSERPESTEVLQDAMAETFHDLLGVPIEEPPDDPVESESDLRQRAYALLVLGKVDEAMAIHARLMTTAEDQAAIVMMDYKQAGWKLVVPERYVEEAEAALRGRPDDLEALKHAAVVLSASGNGDRAMELGRMWLERDPDDPQALAFAVHVARDHGDAKAADAYLARAAESPSEDAEVWLERAEMFEESGDVAQALACTGRALTLEPENVAALVLRGHLLQLNGDLEAAVLVLEAATKIDAESGLGWFNLGTCQRHLGRPIQAHQSFVRAADLGVAQAFNSLGGMAAEAGVFDDAIVNFERAIATDAHYARPWFNLGQVREHLGQYDGAREAYEHAVAIDGGYELAREGLARVVARRGW